MQPSLMYQALAMLEADERLVTLAYWWGNASERFIAETMAEMTAEAWSRDRVYRVRRRAEGKIRAALAPLMEAA